MKGRAGAPNRGSPPVHRTALRPCNHTTAQVLERHASLLPSYGGRAGSAVAVFGSMGSAAANVRQTKVGGGGGGV